MIKFFRKIRQRLLTEGNLKRFIDKLKLAAWQVFLFFHKTLLLQMGFNIHGTLRNH